VSGLFVWTPDPLTPEGRYELTVQVTDNGVPPRGVLDAFVITVMSPPPFHATLSAGHGLRLTWPSVAGLSYRVWFKDQLDDLPWQPLGPPITGTGQPLEFADPSTPGRDDSICWSWSDGGRATRVAFGGRGADGLRVTRSPALSRGQLPRQFNRVAAAVSRGADRFRVTRSPALSRGHPVGESATRQKPRAYLRPAESQGRPHPFRIAPWLALLTSLW